MAKGEEQNLVISIVEDILKTKSQEQPSLVWLTNRHTEEHFGKYYPTIQKIFSVLGGNEEDLFKCKQQNQTKNVDAIFRDSWNFFLEFDEEQHFNPFRKLTLDYYPSDLTLGFSRDKYIEYCQGQRYLDISLRKHGLPTNLKTVGEILNYCKEYNKIYAMLKPSPGFPFPGGRMVQRAYLDCFKDILPVAHHFKPTIRISKFELLEAHDLMMNQPLQGIHRPRLLRTLKSLLDERLGL